MTQAASALGAEAPPTKALHWFKRIWVHALLLGMALGLIMPLVDNGTPAAVDEGVYATQAANLAEGSWAAPRPLPHLDNDGSHGALIDSEIVGDEWVPYSRQPLYPILLAPWYKIAGYRGMLVLSVIGTWVASLASAGLARLLDRRLAIAALWVTGVATPLLFDSYVVLGHSVAAAAAGLVAYSLLRAWGFGADGSISAPDFRWMLGCVPSAIVLVLVRSEGAVFVGSAAVAGTLLSLSGLPNSIRIDWRRMATAVLVGTIGSIAYFGNGLWSSAIVGHHIGTSGSVARETDPLAQTWVSILRPWGIDNRYASAAMVLMVVGVIAAPLLLRMMPGRPILAVGFVCLAAIGSLAHHLERQELVSGLIATIPIVVMGLLLLRRVDLARTPIAFLLGTSALSTAIIIWTSYGVGGTAEWGGRFYHVLLPSLVAVSLPGLHWGLTTLPTRLRWIAVASTLVTAVSISTAALRTLSEYKVFNRSEVDAVVEYHEDLGRGDPIIFATVQQSGLTRLFWRELIDGAPIVNGGSIGGLNSMLPTLNESGVDRISVITDVDRLTFEYVLGKARELSPADTNEWTISGFQTLGATGLAAVQMHRSR